jgi:hypothetical protein
MTGTRWSELLDGAFDDPAGRVVGSTVEERVLDGETIGVVTLRFTAEDLRGGRYEARAKLFLPADLAVGRVEPAPVWFNCGYELPEAFVPVQVRRGRVVVTPCDPVGDEVFPFHNPLCRGPNTDYVLAHLVRGLSFVDPARIVFSGGSAGGYAALLVAAEAFPVAAAVPNVPVVNLTYEGAYFLYNGPRIAADPPPGHPVMGVLMTMFQEFIDRGWAVGYGTDVTAPGWFEHSPIAHLDRITGPVAACFSTADFLVPIEQVGASVAAAPLANLPEGVVMAASELTSDPRAQLRLLDLLGDAADVHVVPVPDDAPVMSMDQVDFTMATPQPSLPVEASAAAGKQWLVTVVDEGPTVFGIGHTRHALRPDFEPFVQHALRIGIGVDQLTATKLAQLIDRWSGSEWLAPGFHHLDRPEAERADVERGLRRYCAVSSAHAERFTQLYADLPARRRVLPDALVRDLAETVAY